MSCSRDISLATRAAFHLMRQRGYRTGAAYDAYDGEWVMTAKHDADNRFHFVRSTTESLAVAALAEVVGVVLVDANAR